MLAKWDITKRCNLFCKHCIVGDEINKDIISDLKLKDVIKILDTLKDQNVSFIHFLGGEPFSRKDFLSILKYCNYLGMSIGITTNGTLLNESIAEQLVEDLNVFCAIAFSLDGPNKIANDAIRGNGNYDICIKNLIKFMQLSRKKRDKFKVSINATLNQMNYKCIEDYFSLAEKLNIDKLSFSNIALEGNAKINCDHLILDSAKIVEVCDRIFKEYSVRNKFVLEVPFPPKMIEFFNTKYNVNIPIRTSKCMIGRYGVYINNGGEFYPCYRKSINEKLIKSNGIRNMDNELFSINKDVVAVREYIENKEENMKKKLSKINCKYKYMCVSCPMVDDISNICEKCSILDEKYTIREDDE